ncbi:uncharacterized protein LOC143372613 isoform X2 [Andrena cerasifolii]|uniref:uncharacterized protein LOC143372613 isoform X2 n=1 Tax=Andrena cerasifolii TaxID=2819439 RepID=UPI004038355E
MIGKLQQYSANCDPDFLHAYMCENLNNTEAAAAVAQTPESEDQAPELEECSSRESVPPPPAETGRKREGRAKDGEIENNPLTKLKGCHRLDWTKEFEEGVGGTRRNWRSRALGGDKRGVNL